MRAESCKSPNSKILKAFCNQILFQIVFPLLSPIRLNHLVGSLFLVMESFGLRVDSRSHRINIVSKIDVESIMSHAVRSSFVNLFKAIYCFVDSFGFFYCHAISR